VLQAIAAEVLALPGWQRHLVNLRAALAERRDALHASLAVHAPTAACTRPAGGVALWVALPDGVDDQLLAAACGERGVRVAEGRHYRLTESARRHIRVSFSNADTASLTMAGRRIGAALKAVATAQ
jgi:DNA-binding transcriptional MocR family regulator